jgi:hypothetical protein
MDANEYLERIVAESYKREIDQEENVARSLPFVAAALAVLATILSFARSYIPTYVTAVYPIAIYTLLIGFGIAVIFVIIFLFLAVRRRRFQYIATSAELYDYTRNLRNYYESLGRTPDEIEKSITEDTRVFMIQQYATGATHNQAINIGRSGARSRAFTSLVLAMALAFAIVVTISVHETVEGSISGGTTLLEGED